MKLHPHPHQHGTATLEFALAGLVFFVVLFGIFELGRILFTWNTLTEATRRGAYWATVCPVNHAGIARAAVFQAGNNNGNSTFLTPLSPDMIKLEYLNQVGNPLAAPVTDYLSIRFVRVSIRTGIAFPLLIPGLDKTITLPDFATTLPVESLGVSRDNATSQCNGTTS